MSSLPYAKWATRGCSSTQFQWLFYTPSQSKLDRGGWTFGF